VVDCAAGAVVTLRKTGDPAAQVDGESLQTAVTDAFGDFKFDGLEPDSGDYEVEVAFQGSAPLRAVASLGRSVTLDTITVGGEG
jgi:hypothetical protein